MALPLLLDILGLFEGLHREVAGFDDILEEVLSVFHRIQFSNIGPTTEISLERLLRLRTQLPESLLLENMIAVALTSELPVCYDGLSPSPSSSAVVTSRFPRGNHLTSVRPDLISEYLSKEVWTDSTAKVISTLLYAHVASSNIFASWLNGEKWEGRSIDHVAITLAAFLDSSQSNTDGPTQIDEKVLNTILEQLFSGWPVHGDGRLRRLDCICFILQRYSQKFPGLSSAVQLKFQALPIEKFGFEVLHVTRHVLKVPACELLATGLLDRALRWTVRHFSNANDYNEDSTIGLEILSESFRFKSSMPNASLPSGNISGGYNRFKLHLVEPVMTVIIKSHLHDPNAVELTVFLVKSVELKVRILFQAEKWGLMNCDSQLSLIDFYKASCSTRTFPGFWAMAGVLYKKMLLQVYSSQSFIYVLQILLHTSSPLYTHTEALCLLRTDGCYIS